MINVRVVNWRCIKDLSLKLSKIVARIDEKGSINFPIIIELNSSRLVIDLTNSKLM